MPTLRSPQGEKEQAMPPTNQKAFKGTGMEGWIARWYARTRKNEAEDFRRRAKSVAERLGSGSDVLEVAPGPGYFAIELARLGAFKITGLDISQTFLEIANENARSAGVRIDFRLGNASAMPFVDESFDFIYCAAAFKNFAQPGEALDEMHRVLRPGGEAVVEDLRRDISIDEIDTYVERSGRNWIDAFVTKWVFRHMLINRAYTGEEFVHMAKDSKFGSCQIRAAPMGLEVRFAKPVHQIAS